ncbi:MAG: SdrD B-like domain-containing protein [Cytophagales bacterium]|nr:SdrD B-like domain-containing protein [Cytophagales bacterium]
MKTRFTNTNKTWLSMVFFLMLMLFAKSISAQTLTIDPIANITVQADAGQCGANVSFDINAYYATDPNSGFDLGGTLNGHTYFVTNTSIGKFWPDSESTAQTFGGHLVAINSQEENDFVRTLTNNTFWIGLNDLDSEGNFVWSNGDPVSYTNWGAGEPNNNNNEDVVEMSPVTGLWNDAKVGGVTITYIMELGDISVTSSVASGTFFPVGTTPVIVTATDESGHTITQSFNITVHDTKAPTVFTQDLIKNLDAGNSGRKGQVTITPEEVNNGSFDACGIASMTLDQSLFECADLGANTVTLTITDLNGNTASATATITIQDVTSPEILGLTDVIVSAAPGTCEATVNYTASVNDNCIAAPRFVPGFTFGGTHDGHTYFVANEANFWPEAESIAQSFGGHLVAINDAAENEFVRTLTASTICIGLNDLDQEGTFKWTNGDPVTYTNWGVGEPNNNNNEDVVEMSSVTGLWNDAKVSGVVPTYILEFNTLPMQFEYSIASGSSFPTGSTEVTFSATDGSGNYAETSFTVTVEDNEAPTAATTNITLNLDASGQASIEVDDIDNGSIDGCGIASRTLDRTSFDCSDLGENTVILIVADSSGNVSTASALVTVVDDTPPAVTGLTDITVNAEPGTCSTSVNYSALVSDNCSLVVPSFPGFEFGGTFNGHTYYISTIPNFWPEAQAAAQAIGANLVAINDAAENEFVRTLTSSTIWIGLNDLASEGNFVWSNGESVTYTNWGPGEPNNNNNEDIVEMSAITGLWNDAKVSGVVPTYIVEFNSILVGDYSIPSGSDFSVGTTEVTYTISDLSGNTATSTFNVTVADVTPPTAIAKDLTIQLNEFGEAIVSPEDLNNGSFDTCGDIDSLAIIGQNTFTCDDLGSTVLVTLEVTDAAGLSNTAQSTLTIAADNIPDLDNDGMPNVCDTDDDNDGIPDEFDTYPLDATNNNAGTVASFLWEDLDGNGVQDNLEPGMGGITVNLLNRDDSLIATTVSTPSGVAYFFDVVENRVKIEVIRPTDHGLTFRRQGLDTKQDSDINRRSGISRAFVIRPGEIVDDVDAGLWLPGSAEAFVWDDLNGNGLQDAGEPGIPNIAVTLMDIDSLVLDQAATDASGVVTLNGVPADRRVRLTLTKPTDHAFTLRDEGIDDSIDSDFGRKGRSAAFKATQSQQIHTSIDAGLWSPGTVQVFVWDDLNSNGLQDAGEPGVSGASVNLLTRKNAEITQATSDFNGIATLNGAPADIALKIEVDAPTGYAFSLLDAGTDDTIDSDVNRRGRSRAFRASRGNELMTNTDAGLINNTATRLIQEDLPTEFTAMIYPNPNTGWFKVNITGLQSDGEALLYDLKGNLIQSREVLAGNNEIAMGQDGLTPGIYFVRIKTDDQLIIKKMKVH